jgi:AraC-like DNA-binding protein
MGLPFELLLVGSCIGAFQSAFFGVYLFIWQRRRTISSLLLALLLIAFAIRIFKSIGYYFSEGHEIPTLLMNVGFGANLAIMPLLWLYLNSFVNKDFVFSWRRDFLQLIPCVAASLVICSLSFLGLGEKSIFTRDAKYQSSGYSEPLIAACHSRLRQHLLEYQVYRDPAITLPGLASKLGVTPNLLSETINKKEGLSFPDFMNRCRVQDARTMLENPTYGDQKIATIAFETGFNSVSAFNTAFKKFTETTPSAFRKRAQKD